MTDKYVNKQDIIIDSHNRVAGGSHGDFVINYTLKNPDVDTVVVKRAFIKKSWYTVQDGQNTFILTENGTPVTITIEAGNWNAESFRYVLQNKLNAQSPNGWTYTVTLPNPARAASTGKYTFTCAQGNPSISVTTHLYEKFGFEPNTTNTFVNNTLTSTNIVYFQSVDFIRIHCDFIDPTKNIKENVLQEISTQSPDFSTMKYECFDIEANSLPFRSTNSFHFIVMNEDYKKLDLSLNTLMTLMVYKKNNINDKTNEMIQLDITRKLKLEEK